MARRTKARPTNSTPNPDEPTARSTSNPAEPIVPSNGIEDLVFVSWDELDQFADNPLNWKTHPRRQMKALDAEISAMGGKFGQVLVFNRVTGRLLDGHGRKALAISKRWTRIPVAIASFTEEEERRLLATMDPIGGMYAANADALASLSQELHSDLATLSTKNQDVLRTLTDELEARAAAIKAGDLPSVPLPKVETKSKKAQKQNQGVASEAADGASESHEDPTSVVFPSSNPFGIPDLLPDWLCTPDSIPSQVYDRTPDTVTESTLFCHSARPFPTREGGFLSFFTEDWRIEGVYRDSGKWAEVLTEEEWDAVCAPDFSLYPDWPFAVNLWSLYRSRWCARLWQELGIRVIPVLHSLSLTDTVDGSQAVDLSLATLPPSPVVAVQCRTIKQRSRDKHWKDFAQFVSYQAAHLQSEVVLIYGGAEHQSKFRGFLENRKTINYVMLDSYMGARRRQIKRK